MGITSAAAIRSGTVNTTDEVPIRGAGWRRGKAVPGTSVGDGAGTCNSRWLDQSRPRSFACIDPAAPVSVACGTESEGAEFAQTAERVRDIAQALLGPAPMGTGILGCEQRQRHRWGLGGIHQEPDAAGAGRQFCRYLSPPQGGPIRL